MSEARSASRWVLANDRYDESTVQNHLILVFDAGLFRAEPVRSSTSDRIIRVLPFDLTWQGHEFLEKIKNETLWRRVKETIIRKGAPLTFDIVAKVATDIAMKLVSGG